MLASIALFRDGKTIVVRFQHSLIPGPRVETGRYSLTVPEVHHAVPLGTVSATRIVLNDGRALNVEFTVNFEL